MVLLQFRSECVEQPQCKATSVDEAKDTAKLTERTPIISLSGFFYLYFGLPVSAKIKITKAVPGTYQHGYGDSYVLYRPCYNVVKNRLVEPPTKWQRQALASLEYCRW